MLTALEASEDRVFSEVRAVALRLERMRNLQKAASTSGNTCPSKEPSTTDRVCPPRPEKPFTHGNMGTPRDQRGRKGGRPPQGSSKPQQRGNTGNPPIATPTQPNSRPSKPNTNQTFAKELQFRDPIFNIDLMVRHVHERHTVADSDSSIYVENLLSSLHLALAWRTAYE
ncbi:hypothetical protein Q1695_000605 [Nippostrongylus brasiliensis]|nr:hypothetical protein Q1695_000605 [Nippostrongylus brasiliensis]